MRECVRHPSNWQASQTLPDWLGRHGVVAIEGIDTRELTLHLREHGALRGVVTTETLDVEEAVARARSEERRVGKEWRARRGPPGERMNMERGDGERAGP